MKLDRRHALAGLLALCVAGRAAARPLPATLQAVADEAVAGGFDGVVVYADRPGRPPEACAAGLKSPGEATPLDPQALFKIASISKLYMAAAAAKLVAAQRLSLDRTLASYLPETAGQVTDAERITLRMLLRHRSGLFNFTDAEGFWFHVPADLDGHVKLVLGRPAQFEPDARYQYCNTNYLFVGLILDRVLGDSHRAYIAREILAPLKLTHTFGLMREADSALLASGHHHPNPADMKTMDYIAPGGSMVATARDVGVFLRALNDGSLLSREEQAVYASVYVYEHTGLLPGYQSIARYRRDLDAAVVVFATSSGEGSSWGRLESTWDRVARVVARG